MMDPTREAPMGSSRFRVWLRVIPLAVFALLLSSCDEDVVAPPNEAPEIRITSPSATKSYAPGSDIRIKWDADDDEAVVGVDLTYTADFGESGTITTDATGDVFVWTTPDTDLYGVVIQAVAKDAGGLTGEDQTDELFAVLNASERGYVTSEVCRNCHQEKWDDLFKSGHPYKLNKVVDGQAPSYPFSTVPSPPAGFTWDDITYVIGGYGWKARFIDQTGHILVTGVTGGTVQYNLPRADLGGGAGLPAAWGNYHAGDLVPKPYTCGTCHTTGWQTLAENGGRYQDGLAGIKGTWEEPGVYCEACHGPGEDHVAGKAPDEISISTDKELCGSCHFRDTNHGILAKGGFIRHHEQYDEMISAKHDALSCTTCHEPHIGVRYGNDAEGGIQVTCESCHSNKTTNSHAAPVDCIDCHMPRAGKSARSVQKFEGDVRTHIFAINSNPVTMDDMFYDDENATFSRGWVSLDFACYGCHTDPISGAGGGGSSLTIAELSAKAAGIHN